MNTSTLKYLPNLKTALLFLLIALAMTFLFLGRNFDSLRLSFLENNFPAFYSHISNLSISCLLLMVVGFCMLMVGARFKHIVVLAGIIGMINLGIETKVNMLNTPDTVDMTYGLVGVLIGTLFLLLVANFGLQPNNLFGTADPDDITQQQH